MRTWVPLQLAIMLVVIGCQVMAQNSKVVMCYYTNWSQYRSGIAKFFPENINVNYCTHVVFAFAKIVGNELQTVEWNDVLTYNNQGLYERFNNLKTGSSLKTLLALGGYNFRSEAFTAMVRTPANRDQFVSSAISFLRQYNFDGLDMDWEYPGDAGQGGVPQDKQNYAELLRDLRFGFNEEAAQTGNSALLMTAAVAAGYSTVSNGYDIPALNLYLDYINLMAYDLHGSWDSITGHNAGLFSSSTDQNDFSVSAVAQNWVDGGASKSKILVGLPTYGRSWTLTNSQNNGVGASANGAGTAGTYTREAGVLAYYEVCDRLKQGYTRVFDQETRTPYLYSGNQWITYDDVLSLQYKMTWLRENGYGGAIVWALDLDDFEGTSCGDGSYPLLSVIGACLISGINCSPGDGGVITQAPTTIATTTPRPTTRAPTTTTPRPTTRAPTTPSTRRPVFTTRPPFTTTQRPFFTTASPAAGTDAQCPAEIGFFRDLQDCTSFYICILPYRYHFDCPPGTYFDQMYQVCAFYRNCNYPLLAGNNAG